MQVLPLLLAVAVLGPTPAQDPDLESRIRWFDPAPDLDRQLLEAIQAVAEEDTVEGRREITRWARWRERVVRTFRHPRVAGDPDSPRDYPHHYNAIAFGPRGRWLVTGGAETVVWDLESSRMAHVLEIEDPDEIRFAADGSRVLIDAYPNGVVLDLTTGKRVWESTEIHGLFVPALSPSGEQVAWMAPRSDPDTEEASLWIRDLASNASAREVPIPFGEQGLLEWSPDGRWIAMAGVAFTLVEVEAWLEGTGPVVVHDLEGVVDDMIFHPSRAELACIRNGLLEVRDLKNFDAPTPSWDIGRTWQLSHDPVTDDWVSAGSSSWVRTRADGTVTAFGEVRDDLNSDLADLGWKLSPDGATLAVEGNIDTVRTWDTRTGVRHQRPYSHGDLVSNLDLSSTGLLATLGVDGSVRVWRVEDSPHADFARWKRTFRPPSLYVTPEEDRAIWRQIRSELAWVDGGGVTHTLPPCEDALDHLAIHPDGSQVLAEGESGRIWSWDLESPNAPPRWTGLVGGDWGLSVAPDGDRLLNGTRDGNLVHSLEDGTPEALVGFQGQLFWTTTGKAAVIETESIGTWDPAGGPEVVWEPHDLGKPIAAWDGSGILFQRKVPGQPKPDLHWRDLDGALRPLSLEHLPEELGSVERVVAGVGRLLVIGSSSAALLDLETLELVAVLPQDEASNPGIGSLHSDDWDMAGTGIARNWWAQHPVRGWESVWEVRDSHDGRLLQSGSTPNQLEEVLPLPQGAGVLLLGWDVFMEVVRIPEGSRVGPRSRVLDGWDRIEFLENGIALFLYEDVPEFSIDLNTGTLTEDSGLLAEWNLDLVEQVGEADGPESSWTPSRLPPQHGATVRWNGVRLQVLDTATGEVRLDHEHDSEVLDAALQSTRPWLTIVDSDGWVCVMNSQTREYGLRARLPCHDLAGPRPCSGWLVPEGLGEWVIGYHWSYQLSDSREAFLMDVRPAPTPLAAPFEFASYHLGDIGVTRLTDDELWTQARIPATVENTPVWFRKNPRLDVPRTRLYDTDTRIAWTCTSDGERLEFQQLPELNETFEPAEGDPAALLAEWAARLGRKWEDGRWVLRQ